MADFIYREWNSELHTLPETAITATRNSNEVLLQLGYNLYWLPKDVVVRLIKKLSECVADDSLERPKQLMLPYDET